MRVDAIVNAANERLSMGGGVCGAIFRAAGEGRMRAACRAIGHVGCGDAVATPGFDLPARWVIHAAGLRWDGAPADDARRCAQLASCYVRSLDVARGLGAASVAFPLISSGAFGCPKDVAMDVATTAIRGWLCGGPDVAPGKKGAAGEKDDPRDMDVYLVVFDRDATTAARATARGLDAELEEYITQAYVDESERRHTRGARDLTRELGLGEASAAPEPAAAYGPAPVPEPAAGGADFALSAAAPMPLGDAPEAELDDLLRNLDASFPDTLLSMIDARGLTDAQVYNRANLTRQYFSKLRSGKIHPSKRVVLALAVALGLDLGQTRLLLGRAGYSLAHNSKFDVIVEFYISRGVHDVDAINLALFRHDQQLLGVS